MAIMGVDKEPGVAKTLVLCGRFQLHQLVSQCCQMGKCGLAALLCGVLLLMSPLLLDLLSPQFSKSDVNPAMLPRDWTGQNPVTLVDHGKNVILRCHLNRNGGSVLWMRESVPLPISGTEDRVSLTEDGSLFFERVLSSDAGRYSCRNDFGDTAETALDVLPPGQQNEEPWRVWLHPLPILADRNSGGFAHVPEKLTCGNEHRILVFVISHPVHLVDRQRIRDTWQRRSAENQVKVVFGMGLVNPEYDSKVLEEMKQHADVIVGNFSDHGLDPDINTIKIMSAFEFFLKNCANTSITHVLFVTHSHVVNLPRLSLLVAPTGPAHSPLYVYGRLSPWSYVFRDPNHPYYISYSHYRGFSQPSLLKAPVFLVGATAVAPLYETTLRHPQLHRHDLLVFGFAAERAGVARRNISQLFSTTTSNLVSCHQLGSIVLESAGQQLDDEAIKHFYNPDCV